jgi:serine/threonine-protein kinase
MPAVRLPSTLLCLLGRALLEGFDRRRLPRAVWLAWSQARSGQARQAEVRAITEAQAEELRHFLGQVVRGLAADRPIEERKALGNALTTVARQLRRGMEPAQPEDLLALLPDQWPVFAPLSQAESNPAIVLRVTEGPYAGRVFRFTDHDTFLVGRSPHAHFKLGGRDRYFSRIHFMIEANPPKARVVDMGSHNGTFLNGQRVTDPTLLAEGDQIEAGHTVLTVFLPGALSLDAPANPPPPPSLPALLSPTTALPAVPPPLGSCLVCNPRAGSSSVQPICSSCEALMLAQPRLLPGYRIVRELGRGGMGVVYLGVREADGGLLAVKTIAPGLAGTSDQVERFLREARVLEALDHPHIVAFREMGEANGLLYFAMDYIRGTDAAGLLTGQGSLPVERAVGLIAQVLQALDYAHAKRFVHRDVKPANILITRRDGEEFACLADFGLARIYQASQLSGLTATGVAGGTPAFMAPEQVTRYRDVEPAADQYTAAATLYALLTGALTHNFAKSNYERLVQLLHDDPIPIQQRRAGLPRALADAIHRALSRDPADRFPNARVFRRALLSAIG